ncbi:MAG: hypothetical protein AAF653_03285, partial [Chloroflexota bacterium]
LVNSRNRSTVIENLELEVLEADSVEAADEQRSEATDIANQLLAGDDVNDNGQVDPFENECGLEQISEFSLLVATMTLREAGA